FSFSMRAASRSLSSAPTGQLIRYSRSRMFSDSVFGESATVALQGLQTDDHVIDLTAGHFVLLNQLRALGLPFRFGGAHGLILLAQFIVHQQQFFYLGLQRLKSIVGHSSGSGSGKAPTIRVRRQRGQLSAPGFL